jgi:hypothetical protein
MVFERLKQARFRGCVTGLWKMADSGQDSKPIEIRITTQGKLRNFIQYGVKCLQV